MCILAQRTPQNHHRHHHQEKAYKKYQSESANARVWRVCKIPPLTFLYFFSCRSCRFLIVGDSSALKSHTTSCASGELRKDAESEIAILLRLICYKKIWCGKSDANAGATWSLCDVECCVRIIMIFLLLWLLCTWFDHLDLMAAIIKCQDKSLEWVFVQKIKNFSK